MDYEPVALLATQVVSGTNYCFLCRGTVTYPDAQPGYYYVYVYEDLSGNAEILDIQEIEFGIFDVYEEETGEAEDVQPKDVSIESLATIGDVQESGIDLIGYGYDDKRYACALEIDGIAYRLVADIPAEVSEAIWDMDFEEPDRDQKVQELLAPLEFSQVIDLNEDIPTQEDLDAWIGKTGQDLLDSGWTINGYDLEASQFWMNIGPYQVLVTFSEDLEVGTVIDEEGLISPLTIESLSYEGLGDPASLDM